MSLAKLRQVLARGVPAGHSDEDGVRRQWWAALATLQEDLLLQPPPPCGVWLASPLPALYEPALLERLQGWVWAPRELESLLQPGAPLLPGVSGIRNRVSEAADQPVGRFQRLSLAEDDDTEPILLILTPALQVALALDGPPAARRLLVRFDASVLSEALQQLDRRLQSENPAEAQRLRSALQTLGPLHNDPDLGMRFWPLMAQRLASMAPSVTLQPLVEGDGASPSPNPSGSAEAVGTELALLEALTHEVRTPLATIRTLIRSLLRRGGLPAVVRQRLEQIDAECSEQIDRFGLIFLAAELQRQPGEPQPLSASELARTDLSELLERLEDFWRRQLERRGLKLRLAIAPDLPPVLSDPARLETMLGGLMDRFGRTLASGSEILLSLRAAGSRLKLQLSSDSPSQPTSDPAPPQPLQGTDGDRDEEQVGPVLSWNPTTGSLQLSRRATQRLFHRLGGRLKEQGPSSLTVFFPLW